MPNRILREGALDSDKLSSVSLGAEVLFYRLVLVADDYGRFDGRVSVIRARCFPVRKDVQEEHVAGWCTELFNARLVHGYVVGGKPFLEIPNFHQRTRAQRSKFPALEEAAGEVTDVWQSSDGHKSDNAVLVAPLASASESVSASASVRPCLAQDGHAAGTCRTDDGHVSDKKAPEGLRGKRLKDWYRDSVFFEVAEHEDNPESWALPTEWRAFCVNNRADLTPETAWANFRDYWLAVPGRDGVKIDWPATWRKWVRREGRGGGARPLNRQAALEARNKEVAAAWQPPADEVAP